MSKGIMSGAASKMEAGLVRNITAKNKEQCKKIAEAVAGDFELQLLVLNTIDTFRAAKSQASGGSLSEHLATKEKNRKAMTQGGAAAVDHAIIKSRILRRGLVLYKRWGPELLLELFQYVEPALRRFALKDLQALRSCGVEILEYAFDIRCATEPADRIADEKTEVLFPRLKTAYDLSGKRLQSLMENIINNTIVWSKHGVYSIEVLGKDADAKVLIKNRLSNATTEISPTAVSDDAQGIAAKKIAMNFSQVSAYISTDEDTYILANYFPKLTRALKRRASSDNAIVLRPGQPLKRAKPDSLAEVTSPEGTASAASSAAVAAASSAKAPPSAKGRSKAAPQAGAMTQQAPPPEIEDEEGEEEDAAGVS